LDCLIWLFSPRNGSGQLGWIVCHLMKGHCEDAARHIWLKIRSSLRMWTSDSSLEFEWWNLLARRRFTSWMAKLAAQNTRCLARVQAILWVFIHEQSWICIFMFASLANFPMLNIVSIQIHLPKWDQIYLSRLILIIHDAVISVCDV
jgi:hypothetical protein